jgi:phosphoketolase
MIVLRSPKGWTGPKVVDDLKIEGTFRAHQVPLLVDAAHPDHVKLLESWMKSYRAEELFDANGTLKAELAELAPKGAHRMGANPNANGGLLLRDLQMPDFRDHAVSVPAPGAIGEPTGTSMSADTRRRARSPRHLTCAFRTTSIAFIWCKMSSIKYRALAARGRI